MPDLLQRILRGEPVEWPESSAHRSADLFDTARREGVHLLVAHFLAHGATSGACPGPLRAAFETALREESATELVGRREICDVVAALHAAGVRPLLFKGAALAFTHYPTPASRPHIDVDVVVPADEAEAAAAALERLGYGRRADMTGALIRTQEPFYKIDRYGVQHAIDLHWKISVPQVFADVLTPGELGAYVIPVPPLCDAARAIGPVHALAVACVHRVAHHHGNDRLIWLYDIHLVAEGLGSAEADRFVELARSRRIAEVCERGLALAREKLGTRLRAGLLEGLQDAAARNGREASAAYLRPGMRRVDELRSDLAALGSWRQRFRLVKEHVLPPADYMRQVYGVSNRAVLPALYAWRFVEGARGWFRKDRGPH